MQAYIALHEASNTLILVFRGSSNLLNWWYNTKVNPKVCKINNMVVRGTYAASDVS